jgi:hypothetical protein
MQEWHFAMDYSVTKFLVPASHASLLIATTAYDAAALEPTVADVEKAFGQPIASMVCVRGVSEKSRRCTFRVSGKSERYDGLFFEDGGQWTELHGTWIGNK